MTEAATTITRPLRPHWPTYQQALAHSVPHAGYRFAFSGAFVEQEEPDGSRSACYWPAGDVCLVEPELIPLEDAALRGRAWAAVRE